MSRSDATGVVAVILACGVAVALIVLAIAAGWADSADGRSTDTTVLSTVLGAAVGAIATYLGVRHTPRGGNGEHS